MLEASRRKMKDESSASYAAYRIMQEEASASGPKLAERSAGHLHHSTHESVDKHWLDQNKKTEFWLMSVLDPSRTDCCWKQDVTMGRPKGTHEAMKALAGYQHAFGTFKNLILP